MCNWIIYIEDSWQRPGPTLVTRAGPSTRAGGMDLIAAEDPPALLEAVSTAALATPCLGRGSETHWAERADGVWYTAIASEWKDNTSKEIEFVAEGLVVEELIC